MPHKCTKCETIFEDGRADILNGCPKCGWNKFLYVRDVSKKEEVKKEEELEKNKQSIKEVLDNKSESEKERERERERMESVRILTQGCYELNLESLLEREEIIMAIKEEGTYVIHLPSIFQKKKSKNE